MPGADRALPVAGLLLIGRLPGLTSPATRTRRFPTRVARFGLSGASAFQLRFLSLRKGQANGRVSRGVTGQALTDEQPVLTARSACVRFARTPGGVSN